MTNKKIATRTITIVALCIGINYIGGTLALWLRLPVYLDSMGTIFAGTLLGPSIGLMTGLFSSVLSGVTADIFSFYYSPVQMLTGLLSGVIFYQQFFSPKKQFLVLGALVLSFPGTIVSSIITVNLFGGVTSSGSSMIVQFLHGLGINQTFSVIFVQTGTDFLDRFLSLSVVVFVSIALAKRGYRNSFQIKNSKQKFFK